MTLRNPECFFFLVLSSWAELLSQGISGRMNLNCVLAWQRAKGQKEKTKSCSLPFRHFREVTHATLLTSHRLGFSYMVKSSFKPSYEMSYIFWVIKDPVKNLREMEKKLDKKK